MSDALPHEKIHYLEFPAKDLAKTKTFFAEVFSWTFTDYGPEYIAFHGAGIEGGFFKSSLTASSRAGGALVVFYSAKLEQTQTKIEKAGGKIIEPIFAFPGGRRFHFTDLNDNEFAVWSDLTN